MKLKELKALIARETVRSVIESKVGEASNLKTVTGRSPQHSVVAPEVKTNVNQSLNDDVPSEAVVYHAKKQLKSDSVNTKLPDNLRKAAAYIASRQALTVNPSLESISVSPDEVLHHLVNFIVEPYAGTKEIRPYLDYLESEQQQVGHERSDQQASIDALSGNDELDLVNVDPLTGEATPATKSSVEIGTKTSMQTPKAREKIKESKRGRKKKETLSSLDEAINNIKSVLKN